jgi:hypothetical protein
MTITDFTILAIINTLAIFFSSYFSKKGGNKANLEDAKGIAERTKSGENEAIKKDISDITAKIKSVETAILEISSKKQDKFFQLRTAITDFANDLTVLVEWKFKTIPLGKDFIDPSAIKEGFLGFISHWATVNSSYRRVILFSNIDNDFITKIWKQFQIITNQYKITIEFYNVLLSYIAIQDDQNGALLAARQKIIAAQKEYVCLRDGNEKIEKKSFDAYIILLQVLNAKLMEKYDAN